MALVMVVAGGGLFRQLGAVGGWIVIGAVIALTAIIAVRFQNSIVPDVLIVVIAFGLISGPIIDAARSVTEFGSSEMIRQEELSLNLSSQPDIYLIVLDGFPGIATMNTDFGGGFGSELAERLEDAGFVVPERVQSSYPATDYSIPSMLEMGYPVRGAPDNKSTLQDLYDVISGDNRLTRLLDQNGYETYMLESGWSGSSCRSWYQHCVDSSWFDDPMSHLLRSSVFDRLFAPGTAYQYAIGSSRTMEWLQQNLADLSQDDSPSFVFAHVLAPHAPFYLNSICDIVPSGERGGFFFRARGVDDQKRDAFLREQIICLEGFMLRLRQMVGDEAVLVFTSDHGTDRRDQTARDPSGWSSQETEERMLAFVAASLHPGCSLGDEVFLPNLMRRVVSCLAEEPLADVPERTLLVNREWQGVGRGE
jgi:hypothetical protein